jgi:hypothetical protein
MQRIIDIINTATASLPTAAAVMAESPKVSARDWLGFFKALADFAARMIPLLIPLFIATTEE